MYNSQNKNKDYTASLLHDIVEVFELRWTPDNDGQIESIVGQHASVAHNEILVELIRADIGRRYAAGLGVNLAQYFDRFPWLANSPEAVRTICFEDFRSRRHRGQSLASARWTIYPAVHSESWFVELKSTDSNLELSAVFGPVDSEQSEPCHQSPLRFDVSPQMCEGSEQSALADSQAAVFSSASTGISEDSVVLGDFERSGFLGQGAFSKVYLARQKSLGGRYVAIKVVNQPLREASHLARLQHTGIVPLYSCHRVRDKWILCMPYSGAATLADWMKGEATPSSRTGQSLIATIHNAQNRITETGSEIRDLSDISILNADQKSSLRAWHSAATQPLHQLASMPASAFVLWIARRLASALAHAHQRGIIHGDLKPANILIRNDGEPTLIDFNLSQTIDAAPKSLRGGTFPYMAVEQLKEIISRTKGPAREQADVFALGVILFEIVEGRLPFSITASLAETDLQMAVHQRAIVPEFLQRQTCTEGLKSIICKCLSADAEKRYSSAVTLLEDLECEGTQLPLRHASESFVLSRLPKLTRRFPRLFSGGSITIASLLLLGVLLNSLFSFQRRSERLASVEAISDLERLSDLKFARFLQADSSSAQRLPSISPDDLKSLQVLVTNHLSPEVDLSIDERTRVEERLLALAYIQAHSSLRSLATKETRKEQLDPIVRLLPESAKKTRTWQLIQAISVGTPISPKIKYAADPATKLSAADKTIEALVLLLHSEPRKSLELLESTDVPESLRLIHWMTRGRALLEINEPRRAVSAFTMAMRDSNASDISLNRGLAYFRLNSLTDADADFTTCIRQSPDEVSGYLNRYAVRVAMGRAEEAMQDLNRAIELQPQSARLRLIRSRQLRQVGQLKAAKDDFDAAIKSRPKSVEDWLSIALAKLSIDPQQSLKDLESAETLYGPDASVLQTMAHVLSEHLNRPDDAICALDRVLQLEPTFQKAIAGRSVLYARLGKIERALSDVKRLETLEAAPTPEALYQMACSVALCSRTQPDLQSRALRLLAQSVVQNYGGKYMASDADLDAIRNLPEFKIILRNYELVASPDSNPDLRY